MTFIQDRGYMTATIREDTRSKRQAIIEAAREIFAKQGYEDTSIADIAAAAGVGVGAGYLFFYKKNENYINDLIGCGTTINTGVPDTPVCCLFTLSLIADP